MLRTKIKGLHGVAWDHAMPMPPPQAPPPPPRRPHPNRTLGLSLNNATSLNFMRTCSCTVHALVRAPTPHTDLVKPCWRKRILLRQTPIGTSYTRHRYCYAARHARQTRQYSRHAVEATHGNMLDTALRTILLLRHCPQAPGAPLPPPNLGHMWPNRNSYGPFRITRRSPARCGSAHGAASAWMLHTSRVGLGSSHVRRTQRISR